MQRMVGIRLSPFLFAPPLPSPPLPASSLLPPPPPPRPSAHFILRVCYALAASLGAFPSPLLLVSTFFFRRPFSERRGKEGKDCVL